MRLKGSLALPALLLAFAACQVEARTPAPPTVSLRMKGAPGEATVFVDDQPLGSLELVMARGVALPVGVHHITVKADGYFPWDKEVEAKLGQGMIRLEANLSPVPD